MKAAFVINARNKERFIYRACKGAIEQTYPCHIILSYQESKDKTWEEMERAVKEVEPGAKHTIDLLKCPVEGKYSMRASNEHFFWAACQTDADWIFQCSGDDYSLPKRVGICMNQVEQHECAIIANTMYFEKPEGGPREQSGFPTTTGYVNAGEGLWKMAYGSTIHGFNRDFLLKVGSAGDCTMDVYYGFLGALDKGYFVVCMPEHVHVLHADIDNLGFQGKMRAAEKEGDQVTIDRINELNRFQLLDLYYTTAAKSQTLYPLMHDQDRAAILQMILEQVGGLLKERKNLHAQGITPGTI